MCFSAPVSFAACAGLSAVGAATIAQSEHKEDRLLTTIPLLLGAQQGVEGIVWLTFGAPFLNTFFAHLFTFFSHLLWPVYVPLAVLYAETDPLRKKYLQRVTYLGAFVSVYLLFFLSSEPLSCTIAGSSIRYSLPDVPFPGPMTFLYVVAICGSCFLSSHNWIRLLGLALFGGFLVAAWFYFQALFSVWCFFAAVVSAIILAHVMSRKAETMPAFQAS